MRFRPAALLLLATLALPNPVLAIDPPYQPQMERLAEILGSLYFLNPLCSEATSDWRQELADLVTLDQPDEDRQQRLYGAFNGGYQAFSRLYRSCTPSAEEALTRLLVEAETTARDIHTRFAE
ncbi:MAG: TIGR02301 family protein [Devosia sp.]|uniref:TIGR02301 family protein n=1 Tax=Devosia sp. TaxID=1871048 RepID=UPI001A61EDC3|nr:TIGR02301 family protein [Devosia sp.]MBL8596561.1 TIGR02301 family protein [Devosia sp.]